MPRGQKSRLRAREKRHQARSEAKSLQGAQAAATEEEETPPTSSPPPGGNPQSSSAAGSSSKSWQPRRAKSATTTSAGASCPKSEEGAMIQDDEMASTSQALPTTDQAHATPIDLKAILLVQFMLHKYSKKEPITKEDILKQVIKKNKEHFPEILKKASELMVLAFAVDVKEIDPIRHHYSLVSKFYPSHDARLTGEQIMPKNGLLMTILCVIFMKGNRASEESVWEVLNVMGIYAGRNHVIYGDTKKLITQDLVREGYLEYQQVPNRNPPRYQFLWGPRAQAETSKMKVLEFLAKVHNTVPSTFPSLYEEALRDEEERIRARFAAVFLTGILASARSRGNSNSFFHTS